VDDALSVSGPAQFIAVTRARLAKIPDIRMAKVEALRAKLESDAYHPDGEAVADGLVREHTPPRRDP
jgi:flagellar biosynthesis anti-sigma factor FlgM